MAYENMTREEALVVFGLNESADIQDVENRYYILTKRVHAEGSIPAKTAELVAAYDVLNGRAEERRQKELAREKQKKFRGKTAEEWKVYWGYMWWRYALMVLGVVMVVYFVRLAVTRKDYDLNVVSLGYFSSDTDRLTEFARNELGFENPVVSSVELLLNAEGGEVSEITMNGPELALLRLIDKPHVILTDRITMPYYLDYYVQLDDFYEELMRELPADVAEMIVPVYYKRTALDDDAQYEDDTAKHIYGLMIEDVNLILAYGFYNLWRPFENPEKEPDPTLRNSGLIFCVTSLADDPEVGKNFIKEVFLARDHFIALLEE